MIKNLDKDSVAFLDILANKENELGYAGFTKKEWETYPPKEQRKITAMLKYLAGWHTIKVEYLEDVPTKIEIDYTVANVFATASSPTPKQPKITVHQKIGTNNGVIAGETAQHFTINNHITWNQVRELVEEQKLQKKEKTLILETIDEIESTMEQGKPIEKGALSKISDSLIKHSWFSNAAASALFDYFIK